MQELELRLVDVGDRRRVGYFAEAIFYGKNNFLLWELETEIVPWC